MIASKKFLRFVEFIILLIHVAKRNIYKCECEIFNPEKQEELFAWMIDKFDEMCNALVKVGELDDEEQPIEKFAGLKQYLVSSGKSEIALSFADIESIIGTALCKSAHTYPAYWKPSPTHTMPNTILVAGYKVASVDMIGKRIVIEKKHNPKKLNFVEFTSCIIECSIKGRCAYG